MAGDFNVYQKCKYIFLNALVTICKVTMNQMYDHNVVD